MVLCVGYFVDFVNQIAEILRKSGLTVLTCTDREQAVAAARKYSPKVVIVGYGVPAPERNWIAATIKAIQPWVQVIFLYQETITEAEMADAILNVHGNPADLIQTVDYLLQVSSSKAQGA